MVQANSTIQVKLTFKTSVLQVWKDNFGFKLLPGKLLILFLTLADKFILCLSGVGM